MGTKETQLPTYTVTQVEEADAVTVYRGPRQGYRRVVEKVLVTAVSSRGHVVEYLVPIEDAPKVNQIVYVEILRELPF